MKNSTSTLFNEENFCKCYDILTVWKNNNLAAKDVILPKQPNNFQLYHSDCYRGFTSLSPKYRKSESEHVEAFSSIPQQQEYDHNDSKVETNESSDVVNIDVSENSQAAEVSNVAVEADIVDQDVT
ncbi:hypothetical protein FQA39_LY17053 [Lamprigera yunnana]|nr:hypothetical protein FQA39_LY17053 [Lamprigera yunnana]